MTVELCFYEIFIVLEWGRSGIGNNIFIEQYIIFGCDILYWAPLQYQYIVLLMFQMPIQYQYQYYCNFQFLPGFYSTTAVGKPILNE